MNLWNYYKVPGELLGYEDLALHLPDKAYKLLREGDFSKYTEDSLKSSVMRSPEYAFKYAKIVLRGRWIEAESVIMTDPYPAYRYAVTILKGRWEQAEAVIKTDPYAWKEYQEEIMETRG